MVNDSGQLYTIEGLAAGILMLVTAYLVVSTTTVLTPQDVHINDMQLEQLGNDVLSMMDTPDQYGNPSSLTKMIQSTEPNIEEEFKDNFLYYANNATNIAGTGYDRLNLNATVTYLDQFNNMKTVTFYEQPYYREKAVKVTRWVYLPKFTPIPARFPGIVSTENQTVLLEVLLWRE